MFGKGSAGLEGYFHRVRVRVKRRFIDYVYIQRAAATPETACKRIDKKTERVYVKKKRKEAIHEEFRLHDTPATCNDARTKQWPWVGGNGKGKNRTGK